MIDRPRVDSMAGVQFKTRRIECHAKQMRDRARVQGRRVGPSHKKKTYRKGTPREIGYGHGLADIHHTPMDFGDCPDDWMDYLEGWKEGKEERNGKPEAR